MVGRASSLPLTDGNNRDGSIYLNTRLTENRTVPNILHLDDPATPCRALFCINDNQFRLVRGVVGHVPIALEVNQTCFIRMTQTKLGIALSCIDVRL